MLYALTQPERELLSNRYGTRTTQHTCGEKSPVGAYKRVEALQFFHVFKTILIVSLRRDEMLTWLIFHLFGYLSDNN